MKTIAIINLGYIGDVVNASPVCTELKKAYPESRLIFITVPSSIETAKCLPNIEEVIAFDRYNKHKGLKIFNIGLQIRKKYNIDAAIVLTENFRSALLAFLTGARIRIGRSNECRDFLLTHKIPFTQEERTEKIHITDFHLRVLEPLLGYKPDNQMGFNFKKEDIIFIKELLHQKGYSGQKIIGLCPYSAREFKDWSFEEAAKFIKYINENTDKKVAIIGTEKAKEFCNELSKYEIKDFWDFTCQTTLPQLAALISKFETFVSVDSAPMHMGLALNIPTVALFFQDNYKKWGPRDLEKHILIVASEIKAEEVINQLCL
jgi:ADP-heptose:LPS heptosyltransferase